MLQALIRIAALLCLALAALLLTVDAREYPGISRPAFRALAFGALPLLVIGVINLRALTAGRIWRVGTLACNVVLLGIAIRMVNRGAAPFAWLLLGVSALLVAGSAALLRPTADALPAEEGRHPA